MIGPQVRHSRSCLISGYLSSRSPRASWVRTAGSGGGAGEADPLDVGVGTLALGSVEDGGDAGRGEEGRVGPVADMRRPTRRCRRTRPRPQQRLDDGASAAGLHRGRCRTVRAVTVRRGSAGRHSVRGASATSASTRRSGLAGEGAPFDGEHAPVGDGGLLGAAGDEGGVEVAGAEEGVRPAREVSVELRRRRRGGAGLRGWRRRRGVVGSRGRRRR